HGVVYDGVLQTPLVLERDRDRKRRETMQKIGRAVERVDDPDEFVVARAAAFLREKGVLGVAAADGGDDVGFGLAVDVGDEIVASLAVYFQGIEPGKPRTIQIPAPPAATQAVIRPE